MGPNESVYTFGDGSPAAHRLALLSATFDPSSQALLRRAAEPRPALAVDLGCGPGHTTRLLAASTGASRTVGLDASVSFVDRARDEYGPTLEFAVHDVTRTPFPTPPADLLFARFVLAHLPAPAAVVGAWCSQLATGGRLVTEETERIDTTVAIFALYEATVSAMVAHHGADLYAGSTTRDLPAPPHLAVVLSESVEVRPPTAVVARMFSLNLATWRNDPFVVEQVPTDHIERIARGLAELEDSDAADELTFLTRQVIFERVSRA